MPRALSRGLVSAVTGTIGWIVSILDAAMAHAEHYEIEVTERTAAAVQAAAVLDHPADWLVSGLDELPRIATLDATLVDPDLARRPEKPADDLLRDPGIDQFLAVPEPNVEGIFGGYMTDRVEHPGPNLQVYRKGRCDALVGPLRR